MVTLLGLHYWAGSGREYKGLGALLPAHQRLLAPDLPGFGAEPVPAGFDFSVAHYADWLARFVAAQGITDYVLLGHSMSGKIALALAARQPAGLRQLLLLSPSPPTPEPMPDADRAAALAAFGQKAEAEKTFRNITQRPLAVALHQSIIADNLRCARSAWDAWLRQGSREDISAQMAKLQVPCSVMVGARDRAITPATQRTHTLPWLPPGTALHVEPGVGHLLPIEAPKAVAAFVRKNIG